MTSKCFFSTFGTDMHTLPLEIRLDFFYIRFVGLPRFMCNDLFIFMPLNTKHHAKFASLFF